MKFLILVGISVATLFLIFNVVAAVPPVIGAILIYSIFFSKGES